MITKNGFTAAEQSVPMQPRAPYFREAGSGTSVVCIHSSASSSGQWRALMERLANRFRVIAVDLYGSGKTAAWPPDQPMHLDDELTLLSPVFRAAGDRFHLIGHSFGAAIALKAALAHRNRVLSLVVYEPVLFSFLIADAPESAAAREITAVRDDTIRLLKCPAESTDPIRERHLREITKLVRWDEQRLRYEQLCQGKRVEKRTDGR